MNRRIYKPLSNFDLDDFYKEIKDKKANIQMYNDIKKNNNIHTLFKNNDYCIIFLDNPDKNESIGHWIMIFFNKQSQNDVFFFDSYGYDINYLAPKLKDILFQKFERIHCNKIKYQQLGDNSATCGRWCILNVGLNNLMRNYDFAILKNVIDFLKSKDKLKTYNQVVSKYIDIEL